MKERLKVRFARQLVYHPLLFAAFFIVFLYAHNIGEMTADQIWLPLGISVAGAAVLWVLLSLILKSATKGGLATTTFLFIFFTYGRFYQLLEQWDVFVPSHAHLLASVVLICGYCLYFINLAKTDFRVTTKVLNAVAVVLIAMNLVSIGSYWVKQMVSAAAQPKLEAEVATSEARTEKTRDLPDIYLIILDEYAHPSTMKDWYDYDNSGFIRWLENKGFFVAYNSKTRTPNTGQGLVQLLNMKYFTPGWRWDDQSKQYVEGSSDPFVAADGHYAFDDRRLYSMIAHSHVTDLLRAHGYKYIYFGNCHGLSRWDSEMKDVADYYFNYFECSGSPWISEFQEVLWQSTALRPFYSRLVSVEAECAWRRQTLGILEHLKAMPKMAGPKFVFAHIFCPHEKFVFGQNGEAVDPVNYNNYRDKTFYRAQYIFITKEIGDVLDALLSRSTRPPIIILQSDHGIRPHHPGIVIGGNEWQKILNVMYLPGVDKSVLHDSISPVNTFRLIFNLYFDTTYKLLPDD